MSTRILHQPPPQSSVPWGPILGVGALAAGGAVIWWMLPSAEGLADTARTLGSGVADTAVTLGEGATDVGDDLVDFGVDTGEKVLVDFLGKEVLGGTARAVGDWWDNTFREDGRLDDLLNVIFPKRETRR